MQASPLFWSTWLTASNAAPAVVSRGGQGNEEKERVCQMLAPSLSLSPCPTLARSLSLSLCLSIAHSLAVSLSPPSLSLFCRFCLSLSPSLFLFLTFSPPPLSFSIFFPLMVFFSVPQTLLPPLSLSPSHSVSNVLSVSPGVSVSCISSEVKFRVCQLFYFCSTLWVVMLGFRYSITYRWTPSSTVIMLSRGSSTVWRGNTHWQSEMSKSEIREMWGFRVACRRKTDEVDLWLAWDVDPNMCRPRLLNGPSDGCG